MDKLNVNYSGHQINAEPISVPENSPYKARTVHNRILKEEPSTIEIWQYSDKSGSWLTEEPYTGTVSSTGKFQVDYDGAEDGDMKFRNTILFHAAQANTEWFIWYKSVGDIYDADDFNAKVNKTTGTENNFAALDNDGGIKDSGKKADDFEPKIDPKGTAFNKNFGNTTGTVCEGNDSRLSDARPPTAHKDSHITGGDDIIPNAVSGGNSGLMTGADKQNLDDAASKKHTQNTDQYLDFGGISQVAVADVKDAVTKKHSHSNLPLLETYTQTETNLADAVSKKHDQNTDQYLDFGGANQVAVGDVKDAVDKKHSQNTDTGTSQNSFNIGDGTTGSDKYVYLKKAASNNPGFRFNVTTSKLQFSHDGTNWEDVGNGSGGADQQARAMALWGL